LYIYLWLEIVWFGYVPLIARLSKRCRSRKLCPDDPRSRRALCILLAKMGGSRANKTEEAEFRRIDIANEIT
jgi:hypothetical protein